MIRKGWVIYVVITVLITGTAWGYTIEKGLWELSGDTNISITKTNTDPDDGDEVDSFETEVSILAQYYIIDNLGLGLGLTYLLESEDEDDLDTDMSLLGIGPMATYNISLTESTFIIFRWFLGIFRGDGDISSDSGGSGSFDVSGWGTIFSAGIRHFINDNVSIDVTADYSKLELDADASASVSSYSFSEQFDADITSVGLSIGLSVFFGK